MTDSTKTADLLDKAADYIETYGWTQNEFWYGLPTNECKVCVRGGISVAAGHHPEFTEEPCGRAKYPLDCGDDLEERLAPEDAADLDLIRAAERALDRYLRKHDDEGHLTSLFAQDRLAAWNDEIATTAEQVITALREAAAAERVRTDA